MNRGAEFASGEVLLFLHADVWLEAAALSAVMNNVAALALLPSSQSELAVSIQQRLDLYTDRRPYRRPR